MKKWYLKAIVQKIVSFLPFNKSINLFFQKHVTKGLVLNSSRVMGRLNVAKTHLQWYQNNAELKTGFTVLEIGTGWHPVIPIYFFLCGAQKIVLQDVYSHLSNTTLVETISYFIKHYQNINDENTIDERWQLIKSLDLKNIQLVDLKMEYHKLGTVINEKFDLITSNNVFEHIPINQLQDVCSFIAAKLKDNGISCHKIDLSDHYVHIDKSITPLNFLKFSPKKWKLIDNHIQHLNRLRKPQYDIIFANNCLEIIDTKIWSVSKELFNTIKIHESFKSISNSDLRIINCNYCLKNSSS